MWGAGDIYLVVLEDKVRQAIKKYKMVSPGDRVVVGISGGPDSLALLSTLRSLSKEFNLSLCLAHLNHMFRGKEAEADARFVKKLSRACKLPLKSESFDVPAFARKEKLSPEEAARQVRYKFLSRVSLQFKANRVALGHTEDDQLETILMRLIRGTGREGLKGIPPVRILNPKPRVKVIRPLIETSRAEIESYLDKHNLKARSDSSNLQPIYLRNKIRLELLPLLKEYNPGIKEVLLSTACILREEEEYLQENARKALGEVIKEKRKARISLKLKDVSRYPRALQRRILREIVKSIQGDAQGFGFQHYENILKLIEEGASGSRIDLPHNTAAQKDYDQLILFKKRSEIICRFVRVLKVPGTTRIPELNLRVETEIIRRNGRRSNWLPPGKRKEEERRDKAGRNRMAASFAYQKLQLPLVLRDRKAGDRFRPLGLKGTKKIKDFLIDRKVPRERRKKTPLLVSGEEIIWVVGEEIAEAAKVTRGTKQILKVTCHF